MPKPKRYNLDDPPKRNFVYTPDPSLYVEPSDATNVRVSGNVVRPVQNKESAPKARKAMQNRNAFRKERPNVAAWNDAASAIPFVPLIMMGGEAAAEVPMLMNAANTIGTYAKGAKAMPWIPRALPWIETALAADMAGRGITDVRHGNFTPETVLDLSAMSPAAYKYGRNFTPSRIREHLYVNKVPIGYDGAWETAFNTLKDVFKGERANIEMPKWLRNATDRDALAYVLSSYSPYAGIDDARAFEDGKEFLKYRMDAWRLYNKLPQKYGTFVKHPKDPNSYTAPAAMKRLRRLPLQIPGQNQIDFVTSVGGNIGVPKIESLGESNFVGDVNRRFGATTTSDWFDLHPFSRGENKMPGATINDKVIFPLRNKIGRKLGRLGNKWAYDEKELFNFLSKNPDISELFDMRDFPRSGLKGKIGNKLIKLSKKLRTGQFTRPTNFLDKLDSKFAKIEAGKFVGAKPFHVRYDIPWTRTVNYGIDEYGNFGLVPTTNTGFISPNVLPEPAREWWKNYKDLYKLGGHIGRQKFRNGGPFKVLTPAVGVLKTLAKLRKHVYDNNIPTGNIIEDAPVFIQEAKNRAYNNTSLWDSYEIEPYLNAILNETPTEKTLNKKDGDVTKFYFGNGYPVTNDYMDADKNLYFGSYYDDNEQNIKYKIVDSKANDDPIRALNNDESYAMYLGIPENERHGKVRLNKSPYRKGEYEFYLTDDAWGKTIDKGLGLELGKNKVVSASPFSNLSKFTVGHGRDSKGDYISYADRLDLNPFKGQYKIGNSKKYDKLIELIERGIVNPIDFYGRRYLDDYFNVPAKHRGNVYLPEVNVTSWLPTPINKFIHSFDENPIEKGLITNEPASTLADILFSDDIGVSGYSVFPYLDLNENEYHKKIDDFALNNLKGENLKKYNKWRKQAILNYEKGF